MSHARPDPRADVDAIKQALSDPRHVCHLLGLEYKPQATRGAWILCPDHGDTSPSCSLTRGDDGTLRLRCFACGFSGDVFHLLAAVYNLNVDSDFPELIRLGAELGRVPLDRDGRRPAAARPPPPRVVVPFRPRAPPPANEVGELWALSGRVAEDADVSRWLVSRRLDPDAIQRHDLARALPVGRALPRWASYQGDRPRPEPWPALGYRCIMPLYGPDGVMRSVRARAIVPSDDPKALPPSGYGSSGLVMANALGSQVLGTGTWPAGAEGRLVVAEGEPDYLVWALWAQSAGAPTVAVLGLGGNGAWTQPIADRIPSGSTVICRFDRDDAGDRYGELLVKTLSGRCTILESHPEERKARRATRPQREAEQREAARRRAAELRPRRTGP